MPDHRGVPAEETSVKDVLTKLATARTHNDARKTAAAGVATAKVRKETAEKLVADLHAELIAAQGAVATRTAELKTSEESFAALAPAQGVEALEKQAETVEETNKKVRENAARVALELVIRDQEKIAAKHDKEIEDAQEEKQKAVAAAKFPIPELTYDLQLGLLLNDAPLDSASDGQKLRLSVAIAIALNPMLNIMLIKQGNLLEAAGRRMIEEMAEAAGALVLMEMVSEDGAGCSVFIEDRRAEGGRGQRCGVRICPDLARRSTTPTANRSASPAVAHRTGGARRRVAPLTRPFSVTSRSIARA